MAPLACHWRATGVPLACPRPYSLDRPDSLENFASGGSWYYSGRVNHMPWSSATAWIKKQLDLHWYKLHQTNQKIPWGRKNNNTQSDTLTLCSTACPFCESQLSKLWLSDSRISRIGLESLGTSKKWSFSANPKGMDMDGPYHPTSSDIKIVAVLLRHAYWVGYWASLGWDSAT